MALVRKTRRRVKRGIRGQSSFVERLSQDTEATYRRAIKHGAVTRRAAVELNRIAHRMSTSVENLIEGIPGISATVFEGVDRVSLEAWRQQNVQLIKTATESVKAETARVITQNPNLRPKELAALLQKQTGAATSRAMLWARDQTTKLHAQVQKERNKTAGIKRYVWRTAGPGDERVRETHEEREGLIFEWDDPPEGGHPGEDIQCRCVPEPILE